MNNIYLQKNLRARDTSIKMHLQTIGELYTQIAHKHNTNEPSNIEICKKLSEEFGKRDVEVVIGGSIAMMCITPPRYTHDIDINIRAIREDPLSEERLRKIISDIPDTNSFTYRDGRTSMSILRPRIIVGSFKYRDVSIDTFVYTEGDVRKRVFEKPTIEDNVKYAPVECLCFWKMMCGPESDRFYKDRADIVSMLKCAKEIDIKWVYLNLEKHNPERAVEWQGFVTRYHKP